jgi:hypothetical protein
MTCTAASDRTLLASSFGHVSNAPIERVAIADWHFRLPDAECARCCSPAAIACGGSGPGQLIVIHRPLVGTVALRRDVVDGKA